MEAEEVLRIIFEKLVDVNDVIESESYKDFVERTKQYYKTRVTTSIREEDWLHTWLLTEEEYNTIRDKYEEMGV